jgi:hypothetical protein
MFVFVRHQDGDFQAYVIRRIDKGLDHDTAHMAGRHVRQSSRKHDALDFVTLQHVPAYSTVRR